MCGQLYDGLFRASKNVQFVQQRNLTRVRATTLLCTMPLATPCNPPYQARNGMQLQYLRPVGRLATQENYLRGI